MVLVKMLMKIGPRTKEEELVMTMALFPPTLQEGSFTGKIALPKYKRAPSLVSPLRRRRFILEYPPGFFYFKTLHIAQEGRRGVVGSKVCLEGGD